MSFAPSAAKRMSHISACTSPIPAQAPLIAAMIGLGIDQRVRLGGALGGLGPRVDAAVAERLQLLHVGAGAEAPAGAGDDDHPHVLERARTRRAAPK